MKMNNKLYDVLKWVGLIVLPAIGAFYFGLAVIWGFPYGEKITGTIALVETFLGTTLGISNAKYKRSNNVVETEKNGLHSND